MTFWKPEILNRMGSSAGGWLARRREAKAEARARTRAGVLAPYVGFNNSPFRRFLRRILPPMVVFLCLIYGLAWGVYSPFTPAPFGFAPAILGIVAIWALPEMRQAPTKPVEWLLFICMEVLILWPNYLAIALPGLPWITLFRIFAGPMTILFLICISVSQKFRSELLQIINAVPLIWKLLVAFVAIQVVTIGVSMHPPSSLQKVINSQFNWTLIFFVSAYVFQKPGRARLWAALFCLSLIPIWFITIYEFKRQSLPWAGHVPSFLKIEDPTVANIMAGGRREFGEYRVQGTFSTSLGLGEYVALTVPFMLHFATGGRYHLIVRAMAAGSIPVCFWIVTQSDSRIGYIGCILSLLMFTGMQAFHMWKTDRRSLFAPAVVIGYPFGATVVFLATLFIGRIRNHVWGSGQYEDSNRARKEMYADGIPMIFKRPWGVGAGNGAEKLGHTNPSGAVSIDTYYILIGLEYGVIGFLVYYGMFAIATFVSGREALRLPSRNSEHVLLIPIMVSLMNYFLIKSAFSQDENHALVYMMMGMAVALINRKGELGARVAEAVRPAMGAVKARMIGRSGGRLQPGE